MAFEEANEEDVNISGNASKRLKINKAADYPDDDQDDFILLPVTTEPIKSKKFKQPSAKATSNNTKASSNKESLPSFQSKSILDFFKPKTNPKIPADEHGQAALTSAATDGDKDHSLNIPATLPIVLITDSMPIDAPAVDVPHPPPAVLEPVCIGPVDSTPSIGEGRSAAGNDHALNHDDYIDPIPAASHDEVSTERPEENLAPVTRSRPTRAARLKSKLLNFDNSFNEDYKMEAAEFAVEQRTRKLPQTNSRGSKSSKPPAPSLSNSSKPLFFMSKKEKLEQIQIQRSINLQAKVLENSRLSNAIVQSGSVNPFFAARKTSSSTFGKEKSAAAFITSTWRKECPWPDKEQAHVGWVPLDISNPSISKPLHFPGRPSIALNTLDLTVALPSSLVKSTTANNLRFQSKPILHADLLSKLNDDLGSALIDSIPSFSDLSVLTQPVSNTHRLLWGQVIGPAVVQDLHHRHNRALCEELAGWMQAWTDFPEEFQNFKWNLKQKATARNKKKGKSRNGFIVSDDEEEDEESGDYEEEDDEADFDDHLYLSQGKSASATEEPLDYHPMVLLIGCPGSGKSSVAHIAASEAGYHVLDMGASEKRSGKSLMDILLPATTSHTVKTKRASFFGKHQEKEYDTETMLEMGKTCILLEDVDVLAEEDKGFWSMIQSVIATSKCPIIMTCTNNPLTVNNPQISTGLQELRSFTRIRYTQKVDPDSPLLSAHLSLSAALMGFYLSTSTISKAREMFGISEYGHGLVQLQYLCTTSSYSGSGKGALLVDDGWKEIFMVDGEELTKIEEEMEIVIPTSAAHSNKDMSLTVCAADAGGFSKDCLDSCSRSSLKTLEELSFLFQVRSEVMLESLKQDEPEFDLNEAAPCCPMVIHQANNSEEFFPAEYALEASPILSRLLDMYEFPLSTTQKDATTSNFQERLSIYEAITEFQCISHPSIVATDMIPFLTLVCRFDIANSEALPSVENLGTRGSRSSRKKAKKHIRFLETADHQFFATNIFNSDDQDAGPINQAIGYH